VIGDEVSTGIVFETKSGSVVIQAKVIINCTGDDLENLQVAGCYISDIPEAHSSYWVRPTAMEQARLMAIP
jgi:hypothetical protein